MEISHVIRAEEHLSNTPRQIYIMQALDFELPTFAHVPYVAEPGSKNKLSKRKLEKYLRNPDFAKLYEHGLAIADQIGMEPAAETFNPVIVDFYEKVGYLPDAVINYLLLLGWSLDDRTEYFQREEMIQKFSLERVNRSPASFDPKKLVAFEETYMQATDLAVKLEMAMPYLRAAQLLPRTWIENEEDYVKAILSAAGDRIVVAGDVLEFQYFFKPDEDLEFDLKAFEKRLRKPSEAVELLAEFRQLLASAGSFDADSLEHLLRDFVNSKQVKIGQVIHALRVAVTGKSVGFGMFETLDILGREHCLARIDRALSLV